MGSDPRSRTPHMGTVQARVKKEKNQKITVDFFLNCDKIISVMRFHAKYFVEVKSATGRLEFVRWFAPSHEGLEKAIACAREAKSAVKCRVAPCDLSNSPHDWEIVWDDPELAR